MYLIGHDLKVEWGDNSTTLASRLGARGRPLRVGVSLTHTHYFSSVYSSISSFSGKREITKAAYDQSEHC